MAEDRLDDAIDAVVRAVDRIERATRRQGAGGDADPQFELDQDEPQDEVDVAPVELRPPATSVAPGRDAWAPAAGPEEHALRPRKKHKKKKHAGADRGRDDDRDARSAGDAPEPAEASLVPPPPAELVPSPAAGLAPDAAPAHAPAEVHELVGRIVARTQELDDHLEAARALRSEITELVARLAAAATHQR